MRCTLMSFGFKYGAPRANYFFDVGFVRNPARDERWNFFSPVDDEMKTFVLEQVEAYTFVNNVLPLLSFLSGIDQAQIFAFGCNAGRHRSPVIVEVLADKLEKDAGVTVIVEHRELDK